MNAEGTSSVAQAEKSHGYLTSSYGSVWLSLRLRKELGREAFIEGFWLPLLLEIMVGLG